MLGFTFFLSNYFCSAFWAFCPLDVQNGYFVIGKFTDQTETTLHLTAFRIPDRHTLYLPSGTNQFKDCLRGTYNFSCDFPL